MSFLTDKLTTIMQRPGEDPVAKEDVPWYMKYGGRIVGTIGGFIACLSGGFSLFSILIANIGGFIGGVILILAGFIVLIIEAPCFCLFIEPVQHISDTIDKRPYWNRAVLYFILGVVPICIPSFDMSKILSTILIILTGVIYGMMSIGKKASRDEMVRSANATGPQQDISSHHRSPIVENAQPMGFSPRPDSGV